MTVQDKIRKLAREPGCSLRTNYSGRGMFGQQCMGVVCDDLTDTLQASGLLRLPKPSYDNMGKGFVVYWPNIEDNTNG